MVVTVIPIACDIMFAAIGSVGCYFLTPFVISCPWKDKYAHLEISKRVSSIKSISPILKIAIWVLGTFWDFTPNYKTGQIQKTNPTMAINAPLNTSPYVSNTPSGVSCNRAVE
jgi:hypothetical protein